MSRKKGEKGVYCFSIYVVYILIKFSYRIEKSREPKDLLTF